MVSSSSRPEGDVSSPIRWARAAALAGYIGIVALCFASAWGPRVLWTMVAPLLPLLIIVAGFHTWRLICPLALLASLGSRFRSPGRRTRSASGPEARASSAAVRRVPEWLERWFFVVSLGFLMAVLVARHVLINGDGRWLGLALIGIALVAAAANRVFSGKAWCNFICPVGVVERVFTDPHLRETANSKCAACTACKKNCPDIDQENAYWKDVLHPARRVAFYGYPGVVLAFYVYYWLRDGRWERFLDGSAMRTAASARLLFGPGFFFLPHLPAIAAASLTMLVLAMASYSLFDLVECLAVRWIPHAERRRHTVLILAAFTALNLYYVFAVPPALLHIRGAARVVVFVVAVIATWALFRRARQSSEGFAQARSARRLLPLWTLDTPPPRDPGALLAFSKGQELASGAQLNAYRDALWDVLAEDTIHLRDVRLLENLRSGLGIGDADHRKLLAALPESQRLRLEAKQTARAERLLHRELEQPQPGGENPAPAAPPPEHPRPVPALPPPRWA